MTKVLLAFLIFILQTNAVFADCFPKHGDEMIKHADFIFIGKAIKTSPYLRSYISLQRFNYYTVFQIDEILKGEPADNIDIFYRYSDGIKPSALPFKENGVSVLMVQKDDETGQYYYSACSGLRLPLDVLDGRKLNEHAIADFVQLAKSYPDMQDIELLRKIRILSDNARREIVELHLFRTLLEFGEEGRLNFELSQYDRSPENYICSNTLNVKDAFYDQREVLVDCN